MAVFDRDRRLVDSNPAFERLVPEATELRTCCAIFGCRDDESPLAQGCITDMALNAGGTPLPEVRVDLGAHDARRAVWVLAAEAPRDHVLVHTRPGLLEDRRRRTAPHWMAGPALSIRVLGPTEVASPEGPLGGRWLVQRPGQLLKLLVCRRR